MELRAGDDVRLRLRNELSEPTNLHFHGLHVSPEGTADNIFLQIPAGEELDYVFRVPSRHGLSRHAGHRVGRNRVLRLMRAAGLLAPQRAGHAHGDPAHQGTITTARPNVMWGTDATRFYTERDGWCWWFGAIDHASDDIVGWHVAKIGDRWAALEPIRTGARLAFGAFAKDVARG